MYRQRNGSRKLDRRGDGDGDGREREGRSIKSIRVISRDEKQEGHPMTSRRSSSQLKHQHLTTHNEIQTHRAQPQKPPTSTLIQKQNNPSPINKARPPSNHPLDKEVQYLQKMLSKLNKKQEKQIEIIRGMGWLPGELDRAREVNGRLRDQLLEMKELMKALLLEREEQRMFSFYLDE